MYNPFESIEKRLESIEQLLVQFTPLLEEESKPENCTVREASIILKVSEQSIHNYIKKGHLPAKKIGRAYLIKRSDIDSSLEEVKSLKYKRN